LLLHYAENDPNINAGIAAYEAALKAAGKAYELHMYRALSTPSTTTPTRRATTRKRRTWPGADARVLPEHLGTDSGRS
jgi:dienelactone hydrolase